MPNWEDIRREWETSDITFKELAEKHGLKDSTIRSRKNREKWQRNATSKNATQRKNVATKNNSVATEKEREKKQRYKDGSRKGVGNPNPENQFTERNSAAFKHGLFSRYIPKATLELMGMLDKDDPADLIWDQIQIQYAAIIRAQQIMYVENKDEIVKVLKKEKDTDFATEKEWEFQFAWDRHANFLNAQSRAMGELRSLIKQFNDLAHDNDERKLKLQLMQANIKKVEAETENITKENETDAPPVITIVDEWTDSDE